MMKEFKKYLSLPNILTFMNLQFGIFSILINQTSYQHRIMLGSIFVVVSALFDYLDGKVARKLNQESDFGKELDSLADIISFGLAPTIIFFNIYKEEYFLYITIAITFYILASAYRLARFNISNEKNIIQGLPITMAALIIAWKNILDVLIDRNLLITYRENMGLFIVLSLLMVSNFKIKRNKI